MFIVTEGEYHASERMLDEIKNHQIDLFKNLDLHFK